MSWYKTAQSLTDDTYWSRLNEMKDRARNEFIKQHPELSADDKQSVMAGHGIYKGACGHVISRCRCGHGSHFTFGLPTKCKECES